jgi:hypothetical protein
VLSPEEIAAIKSEIGTLEKARRECNDGGIQRWIDARVEEEKKKLESQKVRLPSKPSE